MPVGENEDRALKMIATFELHGFSMSDQWKPGILAVVILPNDHPLRSITSLLISSHVSLLRNLTFICVRCTIVCSFPLSPSHKQSIDWLQSSRFLGSSNQTKTTLGIQPWSTISGLRSCKTLSIRCFYVPDNCFIPPSQR